MKKEAQRINKAIITIKEDLNVNMQALRLQEKNNNKTHVEHYKNSIALLKDTLIITQSALIDVLYKQLNK
jgi:hypothetical protein